MEDWLRGRVGRSRSCSVCGDSDCRTLEIRGTIFETIPESLTSGSASSPPLSSRPVATSSRAIAQSAARLGL